MAEAPRAWEVTVTLEVVAEGPGMAVGEACELVTGPLGAALSAVKMAAGRYDGYRVRQPRPGLKVSAREVPVAGD